MATPASASSATSWPPTSEPSFFLFRPRPTDGAPTILIIDDNAVDQEKVTRLLDGAYTLVRAHTAAEGIEACRRLRPDAVLLDIRLPDRDGLSILPQLLEEQVGVVVLTGQGDETVVLASLRAGAHDYVSKQGLTKEGLIRAIGNATDKMRLWRELTLRNRVVGELPIGVLVMRWEDRSRSCGYRVLWRNAAAKAMPGFEHAREDVLLAETMPDLEATSVPPLLRRTLDSGSVAETEDPIVLAGGVLSVRAAALGDDLVALVVDDVTEHYAIQAQMRASQRLEAVGRLAGGIAHDFNNILLVILSSASLLEPEIHHDPAKGDLAAIKDAAERAAKLTRQLLAFSRRQEQSLELIDMESTLEDLEDLLGRVVGRDMQLSIEVERGLPAVRVDPTHFEQVIVNLVVNARDAMPGGGTVSIHASSLEMDGGRDSRGGSLQAGRYVRIAVHDTGCGMSPEVQEHLFEPFFTTKTPDKGTGLGLATCFGIVQQLGGHIDFESAPGAGTTFFVYLPAADGAVSARRSKTPTAPPTGNETILVVDDDAVVRRAIQRILEKAGYRVVPAASGRDALEILERGNEPVALILTDMMMPEMTGAELGEVVAESYPELPLLAMSGYGDPHDDSKAMVSIVAKPFTAQSLLAAIRERLEASGGREPH